MFLSFALFLMAGITAFAQAPQSLNYQGVARSTAGSPLASSPIGLRLTIHDGSSSGATVYQETQAPTTNGFGLYNVAIGTGTVVSGTFSGINWGTGTKFIQVEIDPAGGSSYTDAGTSQLLSVPYSIYSDKAGSAAAFTGTVPVGGDLTGTNTAATVVKLQGTGVSSTAPTAGQALVFNAGNWAPATLSSGITSSGSTNYVPKFTGATSIGNSLLFDNGAGVGLNTITPTNMAKLEVVGVGTYSVTPYYQAGIVADGSATMASASGVFGESGWRGVYGHNPGTATGTEAIGVHGKCEGSSYTTYGYGTKGEAVGGGPTNYGAYGAASGGSAHNYGIYGTASGTGAYAGYFSGNVFITGSIAKGSGTFKIDHPLDPENKYLYHSFVESPDMMNIYNGNITTDANGDATVTLPDYFEALNRDFRYQLTVIGTFAQAIVAEKVNNNQFKIKTEKPNVEVSWQVTGVRHDKYADAHRVVPEVEKEKEYKGYYLHAAEWGVSPDRSIDALTNPKPTADNKPRQQ